MTTTPRNRLEHESSPYLRQHAGNPVDWYPWGPEALERARRLDRPIFLSVGYSACHWCHVMEHESFEDDATAAVLNEHFVSIKVDREERPDIDQIYMTAVQLMTGQGGWPMSVFLTPELKPFYGGTYFPPDDRYGRPSFRRVLSALADAWSTRRGEILESAGQLTEHLQSVDAVEKSDTALNDSILRQAGQMLSRALDRAHGGFGSAPKFPHAMDLRLLLRLWHRFGDEDALQAVELTLDRMARGGMYDQVGGGFHRYSTDERWLVPHFEKMLYDNALLTPAYLEAYQATGKPFCRKIAEETLDYVLREMTGPDGAFYSTLDADSEGVEGKFYVWSQAEIEQVLGAEEARIVGYVYGVSEDGNWEGHNILHLPKTPDQDARLLKLDEAELEAKLAAAKQKLYEVRSRRVWPGRDEKILTSWNGLMIQAFAQAAQVLDRPDYAAAADRAADFLLDRMRTPDGRLFRTVGSGSAPKLNGYLEDYSFLIDALVSLYEATFEPRRLDAALELAAVMVDQFWDAEQGGFFYTGKEHETLITRTRDQRDGSIPSGNSMAALALLRLARLTGRADLQDHAEKTLRLFAGQMDRSPLSAGQMLIALDFHLGPVQEFAVVGDPDAEETRQVLRTIRGGFRPGKVVAQKADGADARVPLLEGKSSQGGVTTFICENFSCQEPLVGPQALAGRLNPS